MLQLAMRYLKAKYARLVCQQARPKCGVSFPAGPCMCGIFFACAHPPPLPDGWTRKFPCSYELTWRFNHSSTPTGAQAHGHHGAHVCQPQHQQPGHLRPARPCAPSLPNQRLKQTLRIQRPHQQRKRPACLLIWPVIPPRAPISSAAAAHPARLELGWWSRWQG